MKTDEIVPRLEQLTLDQRETLKIVDKLKDAMARAESRRLAFEKRVADMEAQLQSVSETAREALDSANELEHQVLMEFASHAAKLMSVERLNKDQTVILQDLHEKWLRRDERDRMAQEEAAKVEKTKAENMKRLATWTPIVVAVIGAVSAVIQVILHH